MTEHELTRRQVLGATGVAGIAGLGYTVSDTVEADPVGNQVQVETPADGWPMFHNNRRNTGVAPSPPLGGSVTEAWTFDADRSAADGSNYGRGSSRPTGIAADSTRVYFGKGKAFYAVDRETGELDWEHSFDHSGAASGTPCVTDNRVYFVSEYRDWDEGSLVDSQGWVTAFDKSGSRRWQQSVGGSVRSRLTLSNGRLYFGTKPGTTSGRLMVLNAADGTTDWDIPLGYGVFTTPAIDNGTVYVLDSAPENALRALNTSDGNEQWRFTGELAGARNDTRCGGPCFTRSSPVVVDGTVYYGSHSRYLYAVDTQDGSEQWRFETSGRVNGSVATDGNTVYAVANPHEESATTKLYAVNDGSEQWMVDLNVKGGTPPVIVDNTVLVGTSGGEMVGLSVSDGAERWRFGTGSENRTPPPAVVDRTVFTAGSDGTVYALIGGSAEETNLGRQQGTNDDKADGKQLDNSGALPVLNRFSGNGESLGLSAGVLGLLSGGGYLAYRRSNGDSETQRSDQQYD